MTVDRTRVLDSMIELGPTDPASVPRHICSFEIGERIGEGTMGVVYRAKQMLLDRVVAVKLLHVGLERDPEFVFRFEREAVVAASLQHENVVRVIDFGRSAGHTFIAFEFVDGTDLRRILSEARRLVPALAVALTLDVLRGLAHAHRRGIVHRDVKPSNVLVDGEEGIARLADFSVARATARPLFTLAGQRIGTPAYMSPEQVRGDAVDSRSDLFSVGVLLFEMLAGRRPFTGDGYADVLQKVLTEKPPKLSEAPRPLAQVVAKALEKSPAARFQRAEEMAAALSEAVREEATREKIAALVRNPAAFRPRSVVERLRALFPFLT